MVFKIATPKEPHILPQFSGKILGHDYGATSAYLTKDGKPYICRMGEIHYSRVPEETWEEELIKMKNGGIDIISSYVFWIHHEEIEGEFCFDGRMNIKKFLSLCKKLSLPFVLRIGPWVHGEARNGGLPDWLKTRTNGIIRTNNETYLYYVRRFFERFYEEVKEYSDNELRRELEYVKKLKEMILDIGFRPAYFTFTGWGGSDGLNSCPAGEVLCLYGGYPEAPWQQNINPITYSANFVFDPERDDNNIGSDLANNFNYTREETERLNLIKNTPFLTCELGGGIHVTYHRRPITCALDVNAIALCKLGSGANGFGLFMYHGGKQPIGKTTTMQESRASKYPNDLPIISYDFQAPLGESGQIRESYYRFQKLHRFLELCGEELATMPAYFCAEGANHETPPKNKFGAAVRSDGKSGYIFLNNHARLTDMPDVKASIKIELPCGSELSVNLDVPSHANGIIPFNFKIGSETVAWFTAIPQYYDGNTLHLAKNMLLDPIISFNGKDTQPMVSGMCIGGIKIIIDDEFSKPEASYQKLELTPIENAPERDFYSHIINYDKTLPTFAPVNTYELSIPEGAKFLRIRADANIGALYHGDALIADFYFYGVDWIVDVRNIVKPEKLSLCILPLTEEDKKRIYFEYDMPTGTHTPSVMAIFDDVVYM